MSGRGESDKGKKEKTSRDEERSKGEEQHEYDSVHKE